MNWALLIGTILLPLAAVLLFMLVKGGSRKDDKVPGLTPEEVDRLMRRRKAFAAEFDAMMGVPAKGSTIERPTSGSGRKNREARELFRQYGERYRPARDDWM